MPETTPRVLIVDDHKVLAETLALALRMNGFGEARAADDLSVEIVLSAADDFKPQIVLLDLDIDRAALVIPFIAPLVARGIKVLVLASVRHPGYLLAECLEAGAEGIFDKENSFANLLSFIVDAASDVVVLEPSARLDLLRTLRLHRAESKVRLRPFALLSSRERAVLMSLTDGTSAEEIATQQFVSIATVRTQIRSILQKLGVNSQLAAVALARRADWESVDD